MRRRRGGHFSGLIRGEREADTIAREADGAADAMELLKLDSTLSSPRSGAPLSVFLLFVFILCVADGRLCEIARL